MRAIKRATSINTRHNALISSAAGGGLLAAALIQTAVAHADVFNVVPDPSYAERPAEFTALGTLPPLDQTVGATLEYNVVSAGSGETVGHFLGVSSQDEDLFGLSTHEILALGGANTPDAPTADSLFSTTDVFGIQNVYSDIVGGTQPRRHTPSPTPSSRRSAT